VVVDVVEVVVVEVVEVVVVEVVAVAARILNVLETVAASRKRYPGASALTSQVPMVKAVIVPTEEIVQTLGVSER
jgi:hypothetical protein